MSEEEKKAIERVKEILKEWQNIVDIEDQTEREIEMTLYAEDMPFNELKILVDLVEQLEKENKIAKPVLEQNARLFNEKERLKNQITKIQEQNKEIVNKNYISKSIILSKIEELDKNGYWEYLEKRDLEKTINILEELLEEQNENRN